VFNEDERFGQSCVNVVTCFSEPNRKELAEGEEQKIIVYSNETRKTCQTIVEDGYDMMETSV